NPEFDQVFEKMAVLDNTPERLALCRRLTEIIAEECPVAFNFHKAYYSVIQPWARRTQSNMIIDGGGQKCLTVDPELRERPFQTWNRPVFCPVGGLALVLGGAFSYAIH